MTDPTATDDYRAILRTILEDPADDLPRLVLADWLDERGGPAGEIHARFIRTQVAGGTLQIPPTVMRDIAPVLGCPPRYCTATSLEGVVTVFGSGGPELTYRRGFASAVTLTQAAFVGGECDGCRGSGRDGVMTGHRYVHGVCPTCKGTGRTPGLAAELFAAHPITAVTLSDVGTVQSFNGWHFARWPDGFTVDLQLYETTYLIRDPLWSAELIVSLRSSAEAHAALSRRCVDYGRHVAGLTSLSAPVDADAPAR